MPTQLLDRVFIRYGSPIWFEKEFVQQASYNTPKDRAYPVDLKIQKELESYEKNTCTIDSAFYIDM